MIELWRVMGLASLVVWGGACGGAESTAGPDVPAGADIGDVGAAEDASGDTLIGDAGGDVTAPTCTPPAPLAPDPVDPGQTRFALSLFHFNIQYVIGGLEYYDDQGRPQRLANAGDRVAGWGNDEVEDWIIRETFRPILEIYARHPSWRVDIELQAYMIEVMAARHPATLALLRELAQRGQVELISFHYAAQLFLAFPREDLIRSLARTREVFETHCLPLSGVVFNQEGQAGEGRQRTLVQQGWKIGVFPKNLWRYVRGDGPRWPYYASEGGTLIVGPGEVDPASGVEVAWDFFDDGELRATADWINPYLAPMGGADPDRLDAWEAQLQAREDAGYKLTHISDYVHQLAGLGVDKPPAPPLLDGTWQPQSTDSIHRWLGGRNQVFVGEDADNTLRTRNAVAHAHAVAAQVMVDAAAARGLDVASWRARLRPIWEDLWHAEVSDGSGVNPWRGELRYCLGKSDDVIAAASALRAEVAAALDLDGAYRVDLRDRTVTAGRLAPVTWTPTAPPADLVVEAAGREVSIEAATAGAVTRVRVALSAAGPCDGCDAREISARFARTSDTLSYSPGLIEDEVRSYDLGAFEFTRGEAYLPLPNGLIGLDGQRRWVVKDTRSVHLAARIAPGADASVAFIDRTIPREAAATWVFYLVDGPAEVALAWANRVNVHPWLSVDDSGAITLTPGAPPDPS